MNGTAPAWLERLLGIQSQAGEGASWSLDARWPWPPWLTLLLLVFVAGLVVWVYRREGQQAGPRSKALLAGLRLASLAVVLAMIAQFALSLERTGLPYLAVIVDDSASMGIVDRYDEALQAQLDARLRAAGFAEASRWNLARTLLAEDHGRLVRDLADRYKVRLYALTGMRSVEVAGPTEALEDLAAWQPDGASTRLGAAVRAVLGDLRGSPPAAIILLTDGVNTEGPTLAEAAQQARHRGVPLVCVGLGDDRAVRDVRLSDLLVDDVVFAGDVVCFQFHLSGTGLEGRRVAIVLREADKPETLARLEAAVPPDGQSLTLRLPYRTTQPGAFRFLIEAEPQPGERDVENNRLAAPVDVRKDKIRVLLVEGYPNYEYRYLRNLLAREPSIELHTILQDSDPDHVGQDTSALAVFPVRRDELAAYDVVILGDANPALLGPSGVENLAQYVTERGAGGALAAIAGPRYMPRAYRDTPLAAVLPIVAGTDRQPEGEAAEGFRMLPTPLGLASPPMQLGDTEAESEAIWRKLPPLYWMVEAEAKPAARVLAEDPKRLGADGRTVPLLLMQYVGAGRVLFQATDETWRWRWRVGDAYFARYWIQTIRFLAHGRLAGGAAELTSDRRQYERGDTIRLRLRFRDERQAPADDDGATVVVERQGQKERLRLQRVLASRGVFEGTLPARAPGDYHAWLAIPTLSAAAPSADFTVLAPAGEMAQTRLDSAALKQAAELSKGAYYTFSTAASLVEDLPQGRQVPIEVLPPKPLWNRWPLLALLVTLLSAEWVLRKKGGLA